MKLSEVLTILQNNNDYWFRPISWKGSGMAYVLKGGFTHVVPSSRGGDPGMTNRASDLMEDWEIINADTVLRER